MDPQASTLVKKEQHSFLYNIVRRVLLASVGAAALAEEEIQDFLQKLVERGEIAEQERDNLAAEILVSGRKNLKRVTNNLDSVMTEITERPLRYPSFPRLRVFIDTAPLFLYNQIGIPSKPVSLFVLS